MNETHLSLNNNVFSLIKRVKHLAEFTDYPLLEVLAIYLQSNRMFFSAELCKLPPQCWYFDWQFALSNLQPARTSCSRRLQIPRQIPPEIVYISWNSPKMISLGRKSDEKCYVEELARFAVAIKEFCVVSGTEYNLLLFNFRVYIYTRSYPVNVSLSSVTALIVTGFCHKQFVILSHTLEVNR